MPSLNIVYEDENIIAINKPAGIAVHKTHPNDTQITIADLLLAYYPDIKDVGDVNGPPSHNLRPGIVHRLDKDTSGIMLTAKTQEAFLFLKKLFQDRKVQKYYLALVYGRPQKATGTIDLPLGKIGTKQTTQLKGHRELVERDAITDYRTEQEFKDYTLLSVMPHTGRTHQIRVHLKALGHPIVGDPLYAPKKATLPAGLHRLFLHAERIDFTTPDNKSLSLGVDLPEELHTVLQNLATA